MGYTLKAARVIDQAATRVKALPGALWHGRVASAVGMVIKARGLEQRLAVGDRCKIALAGDDDLVCEVVGVHPNYSTLMAFGDIAGVTVGSSVTYREGHFTIRPSDAWVGRVMNAMGEPVDGKGPLPEGAYAARVKGTPPPAFQRRRISTPLETKVRVIDSFTPLCRGQRVGIFAGSGVGKSTLLSMLARSSEADVNVIGLIGERGREVQEFLQRDLGEAGLARSIVVVSTSDEAPLARRQAAYLTMALAEDQRKRGRQVFCMIDSVTRFAHALREIGLAVGEPPSARGYPPSVYGELSALLERAGPGISTQGDVTLAATVLVDGSDHEEPIGDAVRGILDGHIVLDRRIAARGRFPAVNVPQSLSRLAPDCYPDAFARETTSLAREAMSIYDAKEDIIQIGLYQSGTDKKVDAAIALHDPLEDFCRQGREEAFDATGGFERLGEIVGVARTSPPALIDEETA